MAEVEVDGARLFYEAGGDGAPLVLVHGSWGDHHNWDQVVHGLALRHRVLVYDRRGHSASERPAGQGSRREDEDDLAALMEALGFAPAFVAGNSFGASTALGLAARRPGLFRALAVHEPPLLDLAAEVPEHREEVAATRGRLDAVAALVRAGDPLTAARTFVDGVAFGPGEWERFPQRLRDTFVANAPTFLDEQGDPGWAALDVAGLRRCAAPVLLTRGSRSPSWFRAVYDRVAGALPGARTRVFEGAGHVPHVSHPQRYVEELTAFFATAG
ncbi:alpha/beta fold hydrolase [Streptomyces showdoensis]|uniref:Alpha/beta hydrolase n=1 Tax=Streptomyces showdoensis TaxID=68268 RepID=A0A2P2GK66_STREW|nr:alpha/beta hydrolase [Streptomyces showdoensis]KKZ71902.1 alpha/beta hydrolase [Streptomyces showdoensis]